MRSSRPGTYCAIVAIALPDGVGESLWPVTNVDGLAAGDHVTVRIRRNVGVASNATGDCKYRDPAIEYTTT